MSRCQAKSGRRYVSERNKNTNTIILNNLDIEKIDIYDNNQYDNYYFKSQLIKYLERIKYEKESNYNI